MARISYLEYSNRDIKYANDQFKANNYDPCGRHCQQSIEKRMKHYIELVGNSEDYKSLGLHSLTRLYRRICSIRGESLDIEVLGCAAVLTDYFDTNYPQDDNIELDEDMAVEALKFMSKLNSLCDEWINSATSENKNDNKIMDIFH